MKKNVSKVELFWEEHKNLSQSALRFWTYEVMSKPWDGLLQIFVAFSEKLNFTYTNEKKASFCHQIVMNLCTASNDLHSYLQIWINTSNEKKSIFFELLTH